MNQRLKKAIEQLSKDFNEIEWKYAELSNSNKLDRVQLWPGNKNEDIMLCVFKGKEYFELFHRQDYFFLNFAYQGNYHAISYRTDNEITIKEGECYISQPYAGYAIRAKSEDDTIIAGILIQRDAFFKNYFQVLSTDKKLFQFFLTPSSDDKSEEYIHLTFEDDYEVRNLINLLMLTYCDHSEYTQDLMRPLTLSLLQQISKQYQKLNSYKLRETLPEQLIRYISENCDSVTLKKLSDHFSYHPNYISTILTKETGKSFSEHVLEQRMERSVSLLKGTTLSTQEIAYMVGYSNHSNFFKVFKEYYGVTPREFSVQ